MVDNIKTSGKQLQYLDTILSFLQTDMYAKRMKMKAKKGYPPGLRRAAKAVGISTATYQRAENGNNIDIQTLRKILKWIGN